MTLTAPTTTSNWSHALSLRERRGASGPPADAELAARRFARWQSQPPFTDPDLFGQRLGVDGLTADELRVLLGESSADLARRIDAVPGWVTELTDALAQPDPLPPATVDNELALLAAVSTRRAAGATAGFSMPAWVRQAVTWADDGSGGDRLRPAAHRPA